MTKWQIVQMLLAEWRLAETLKLPVITGVPEDSAFRHSANRHSAKNSALPATRPQPGWAPDRELIWT